MPDAAPHYDPRLLDAVRTLDDTSESMAETCRRVGRVAEALGLSRPSIVHLRTYVREHRQQVHEERLRRAVIREIAFEMGSGLLAGRIKNAYDVEELAVRRVRARGVSG